MSAPACSGGCGTRPLDRMDRWLEHSVMGNGHWYPLEISLDPGIYISLGKGYLRGVDTREFSRDRLRHRAVIAGRSRGAHGAPNVRPKACARCAQDAIKVRPRCAPRAPKGRPWCAPGAPKVCARCAQDAPKVRPRCPRGCAPKVRPRRAQGAPKVRPMERARCARSARNVRPRCAQTRARCAQGARKVRPRRAQGAPKVRPNVRGPLDMYL